ncbi:MAG: sel1 repeat family protein [Alphaproteobacteria bacterium]|mgnify:CR=1 FL=1|nr:sel1 repeat family protein [Alphaproteobacteria bacterium]HPF47295.1 hypothetical protein [Emcibacteraceae bacterium]HRW29296.1 hypothetical protein [Emcibacteraceae bacterium]
MKKIVWIISILFGSFYLASCGTMHTDCTTLINDRDAYRQCTANQGNAVSQFELGVAAFDREDYKTAISWLKRAAKPRLTKREAYIDQPTGSRRDLAYEEDKNMGTPGHQGAQRLLVRIYEEGIGVPVNHKEAERYRQMIQAQ